MSNLDLVDTRNDDDQYFGDEMPLSIPSQKRKIDEVSDGDDDLPILYGQESEKADRLESSRGFILSSQLEQAEDEEREEALDREEIRFISATERYKRHIDSRGNVIA